MLGADRRIRTVREQDVHDLLGLLLVIRQPHQRCPVARGYFLGAIGVVAQQVAEPLDLTQRRQVPDTARQRRQQPDHLAVVPVHRKPERRRVPLGLARIDLGAPVDQDPGGVDRVRTGGSVQGTLLVVVLDLDRHARVEQERDRIGPIALGRREDRSVRLQVRGVRGNQLSSPCTIAVENGLEKRAVLVQRRRRAGWRRAGREAPPSRACPRTTASW